MRAFVAIDLAADLKKSLQDLVLKLQRTGADVRWANFIGMHLTLKFLGEIDPAVRSEVDVALRGAAAGRRRFPLVLRGTGSFPGGRNPRVFWVGVREEPGLMDLQQDIDERLAALGFPREERAFHPHLTLGRVKGPARIREASEEMERYREAYFGEMTAGAFELFESVLKPQGAEYKVLSEYVLQ